MYLHVFTCGVCRAFKTIECPWYYCTKENSIACENFSLRITTFTSSSSEPMRECPKATVVSAGAPIEVEEK